MTTILMIDDEESTLAILGEVLSSAGYQVKMARDGAEGMRLFEREHVDLVITDMVMPVRDGLETILALREREPALPVIAISAGGTIPKERYLELAGCLDNIITLPKPISSEDLLEAVAAQLDSREESNGIRL